MLLFSLYISLMYQLLYLLFQVDSNIVLNVRNVVKKERAKTASLSYC